MRNILLGIILLLIGITNSYASHIPGGNITYQCTGNPNEYIVTMTMFVSCPSTLGTSYTIQTNNDCGLATSSITLNQVGTEMEVSQICDAEIPNSDCNTGGAGGIPGVMMYTYEATVTLAGPCDSWTFYFDLCCRDQSTNMAGGTGNSLYIETTMNSQTAPCDNSISVTAQPIPYVCAGQSITYCPGAIDVDGDSLYYQLIPPFGGGGTPIGYNAGYTNAAPLQGTVFDSSTGCMTFNQSTIGNFVVAYLIEAYDANGNLTGSIVHDFQFEVISCAGNSTPTVPPGGISLTSGNANQTGPNTIQLCEGESACFSMQFTDADAGAILTIDTINSNIFTVFPGATYNVAGTNPLTIDVCWTVPLGTQNQITATTTVVDDNCPIQGSVTQVVVFDVVSFTTANSDLTICGSQNAQLSANGGTVFNWSVLSGPPINVGTNFSCNPCASPVASPTATTTYLVTSDLVGCRNTDTVTVNVVPDFTATASQSSTTSCLFEPIQLDVTVVPAGPGYTYQWSPATYLSSTTIPNPVANITAPGVYQYIIDVTSPDNCVKSDTISITVAAAVQPDITILTSDTTLNCGDSLQVELDLGGGTPAICGPSINNTCTGPTSQTTVGNVASNISTYPTPYNGGWHDGRIQVIYTAAELNAMGFLGGKITEVAFNVTNIGNMDYTGLTISMMCTPLNDFSGTGAFVTGTSQVYSGPPSPPGPGFTPVLGWNTHTLDNAYDWDGTSNLLIEICFDNNSWSQAATITQTITATPMSIYDYADFDVGCTLATPTQSNNRPDIRLTHCPTIPDPNSFSYAWTPNTNITTSTMQNPLVYPAAPTSYIVTVTDIAGGCTDTDTLNVNLNSFTLTTTQSDSNICVGSTVNISVTESVPDNYTYNWSPGNIMNDSTIANPISTHTNGGIDTLFVEVSNGNCLRYDTIVVYVSQPENPTITINNISCNGFTDGAIYMNPTFTAGSEVQNFTVIDSISGATLQTGNDLSAGMTDSITGLSAGAYTIVTTDSNGCFNDTTVWITEPDPITINNITNDTIICINGTKSIDATAIGGNNAPYTYNWTDLSTNNPITGNGPHIVNPIISPTCYSVWAEDLVGCISDTQQVCIDLFPTIIANTTNTNISICPEDPANIDISAIGGSSTGYNYDWYENGNLIGNGGNISVTPTSSPTTYIGVATENCTTPSDSVEIIVDWFNLPTPLIDKNKEDSCYNMDVVFTNTSVPAALIGTSEWTIDGNTYFGPTANHTFTTPVCKDVSLKVTTIDGCEVDTTYPNFVCPHPFPIANFDMTPPITDLLNTEIDFNNLSTGNGLTYSWNFGSGLFPDSSSATHPSFIYPNDIPGNYNVTLTVTNQHGCVDIVTGVVIINGIYLFYAPNTFTPDGDGLNEIFRPYGDGIDFSLYTMEIYDRWGELIYQTDQPELGWDGTYKGTPLPIGTYVWKIVAKEEYGTIIHDNYGHVNLIR